MRNGIIYGTTDNPKIDCKIEWNAVSLYTENASEITASLYFKRNDSGAFVTVGDGWFEIRMDSYMSGARANVKISNRVWEKAITVKRKISHDPNGEKTVTLSATGGFTGLLVSSCTGDAVLDAIPLASTVKSAGDAMLTQAPYIRWVPQSADLYYRITYAIGKFSLDSPMIHPGITAEYLYAGTVLPLSVAAEMPSSKTGKLKVTLITYVDAEGKTPIGQPSEVVITVTVPKTEAVMPKGEMKLSPVHTLQGEFQNLYIQGKTKVQATFTDLAGAYGATVTDCRITVLGKTYGAPYLSDEMAVAGTHRVTAAITDSRGFTTEIQKSVSVIPYGEPQILPHTGDSTVLAYRCDLNGIQKDDGVYLLLRGKKRYSKIESGGENRNRCVLHFRSKKAEIPDFTSWQELPVTEDAEGNFVSFPLAGVTDNPEKSYTVELEIRDSIGGKSKIAMQVLTAEATFHLGEGGRKAAFGKLAEKENCLDVAWNMQVRGAFYPSHIAPIGSYDGMHFDTLTDRTGYYMGKTPTANQNCPANTPGILLVLASSDGAAQLYFTVGAVYYRFCQKGAGFDAWTALTTKKGV